MRWLANWAHSKYGLNVEVDADARADSTRKDVRTLLFESTRELLVNVVKHAGTDRVTLTVTLGQDGQIRIVVADDGSGFDAARLDAASSAEQAGWGLFSIRERLVLLGGRLEVNSAPGCGARFELVAPCDEVALRADPHGVRRGSALASNETAAADGPSPHVLRVLVVDDHGVVRRVLRETLNQWPQLQVVGEAADGREAIAQTRLLQPQAVVMDISMPRMNGVEATRQLHMEFPTIRILGWSMQPKPEGRHPIEEAGASGFFVKGTDTQRLIETLLAMHERCNAVGEA
jgi:CheY-like chemotaxis protein